MRGVFLGQTGLKVSEPGFEGIPVIRLSREKTVEVLLRVYERGIPFYDTANMYLGSEEKSVLPFTASATKWSLPPSHGDVVTRV